MNNESDFQSFSHVQNPETSSDLAPGSFFYNFVSLICTSLRVAYCRIGTPEVEPLYEKGDANGNGALISRGIEGTELTVEYAVSTTGKTQKEHGDLLVDLISQALRHKKISTIPKQPALAASLSPYLQNCIGALTKMARSRAPIVISGDTGTGKSFLSRWIHDSGLVDGPYILVDIASIPEQLLELELFGNAEGAFTDAKTKRAGKIALAHEGTLVLDGIETISLANQAKLLRVLQDGSFYPLGSTTLVKVSCRLIVLSQMRLEILLEKGRLREDLYYRINVLPFHVKSLRERHADVSYFVTKFAEDFGASMSLIASLTKEAQRMPWAGNIRELHNFVTSRLTFSDLGNSAAEPWGTNIKDTMDLKNAIRLYKKAYIHDILLGCNGNQTQAARILGIERTYLARLIKELLIRL